jgi:hypothetical protein
VAEVDHLLIRCVGQTDHSTHTLGLGLLGVDGREHFLQASTDHPHLSVLVEVVQNDQRLSEGHRVRLSPIMKYILHSAVVDNAETHLSSAHFHDTHVVLCVGWDLLSFFA